MVHLVPVVKDARFKVLLPIRVSIDVKIPRGSVSGEMEHLGRPLQQWPYCIILLSDHCIVAGRYSMTRTVQEVIIQESLFAPIMLWDVHISIEHLLMRLNGRFVDKDGGVEFITGYLDSGELIVLEDFIKIANDQQIGVDKDRLLKSGQ